MSGLCQSRSRGNLSFRSVVFALRNLRFDRPLRFLTTFEMTTGAALTEHPTTHVSTT
jgi:hypothetical protein